MDNKTFIFRNIDIHADSRLLLFHYSYEEDNRSIVDFTETLALPEEVNISQIPQSLLEGLHIICGISYYKLYCPKKIDIRNFALTKGQADFWNTVYTKGLGEFFYKNNLDYRDHIHFPYDGNVTSKQPSEDPMDEKALVTIGGGKDSIVSLEVVRKADINFDLFVMNKHQIMQDVANTAQQKLYSIERTIDPRLLEYNALPDTYNGHVPISAIYAFVSLLYAYAGKYSYVVFANERSSNYGNAEYLGETVSHQWSKSREFEDMFRQYINKYICTTINYFSILRPLYEISIAKIFIKYPHYFSVFSSSNHNFKIKNDNPQKWDKNSAKTAFAYSLLAAYLPKSEVVKIFGQDLYGDNNLLEIFRELLGLKKIKPFDCVGTPEEVTLAMYFAHQHGDFEGSSIMKMFIEEVLPSIQSSIHQLQESVLSFGNADNIPNQFLKVLKESYEN